MNNPDRILSLSDISPHVRYVHACFNANRFTHQVPSRCIYDHELIFVRAGRLDVVTGDKVYTLTENTVHVISPLIYHTIVIPDGAKCTYYSVHFDYIDLGAEYDFSPYEIYISMCNKAMEKAPVNDLLSRRPRYIADPAMLPEATPVRNPVEYTGLLESMIRIQREKPFAWEIDMKCAMLSLLKLVVFDLRQSTGLKPVKQRLEHFSAITAYMIDHYNEDIDLNELTRMFGYSYSSFRKQFKARTGVSPHLYIIDLRMNRAVDLLRSNRYTVSEVAFMVGYEDSSYFTRLFRKHKGCTPSAFLSD